MSLYSDLTEVLTPYANKIKELNGSLETVTGAEIKLSEYPVVSSTINNNGVWWTNNTYLSRLIPVEDLKNKIDLYADSANLTCAFLKSDNTSENGKTPDYSVYSSSQIKITSGESLRNVVVPDDCAYLWVSTGERDSLIGKIRIINPSDIMGMVGKLTDIKTLNEEYDSTVGALTTGYTRNLFLEYEKGSLNTTTLADVSSTTAIRTKGNIPYETSKGIIIIHFPLNSIYKYSVLTHHPTTSAKTDTTWKYVQDLTVSIPEDHYARIMFQRQDGSAVTQDDIDAIAESISILSGDTTNQWMNQVFDYASRTTSNKLLKYGDPNLLGQEYQIIKFPKAGMIRGSFTRDGVWRDVSPFRAYTTDPENPMYLREGTWIVLEGVSYGNDANAYRLSYDRWDEEGNHYNQDTDNGIAINTTYSAPFKIKIDSYYTISVYANQTVTGDEAGFSALTICGKKTGFSPYPQEKPNSFIKSVAHRGFWGVNIAEANTLDAYKAAKNRGFIYVETDIQFTSDDVPVLSHDDKVVTNTDTIYISNLTYDELMTYTIGTGNTETHITSLEELISWCRINGTHPYLELKVGTQEQIQIAWDIVAKYGMTRNVSWISFQNSGPVLTYVKNIDPRARLGVLGSASVSNMTPLKTTENEVFSDANVETLTLGYAKSCLAAGIPVEVYTINKVNVLLQVAEMGISGITTDGLHAEYTLQNQ